MQAGASQCYKYLFTLVETQLLKVTWAPSKVDFNLHCKSAKFVGKPKIPLTLLIVCWLCSFIYANNVPLTENDINLTSECKRNGYYPFPLHFLSHCTDFHFCGVFQRISNYILLFVFSYNTVVSTGKIIFQMVIETSE